MSARDVAIFDSRGIGGGAAGGGGRACLKVRRVHGMASSLNNPRAQTRRETSFALRIVR